MGAQSHQSSRSHGDASGFSPQNYQSEVCAPSLRESPHRGLSLLSSPPPPFVTCRPLPGSKMFLDGKSGCERATGITSLEGCRGDPSWPPKSAFSFHRDRFIAGHWLPRRDYISHPHCFHRTKFSALENEQKRQVSLKIPPHAPPCSFWNPEELASQLQ